VAEDDFVVVHGRFSGFGAPVNWIAVDIVRIQNGILVEHWMSFKTRPQKSNPRAEIHVWRNVSRNSRQMTNSNKRLL